MILIDCLTETNLKSFDASILLAQQLERAGFDPVLDETRLPESLDKGRLYEASPFLADLAGESPDRIILLGVDALDTDALDRLRFGPCRLPPRVDALGRFASNQARIDAETRISYALGQDISVLDLNELQAKPVLAGSHATLFGEAMVKSISERVPVVQLYIDMTVSKDDLGVPILEALSYAKAFRLEVIIAGAGKAAIRGSRANDIQVYAYSELPSYELSARADVLAIFGTSVPGERMAQHAANMIVNGRPVIDCTADRVMVNAGIPAIAGPGELASLSSYLEGRILPDLLGLAAQLEQSRWTQTNSLSSLLEQLNLEAAPRTKDQVEKSVLMLPTNGTGLGHARRTLLIAKELKDQPTSFAAFPSCVPMIQNAGFACDPLVSRSDLHSNSTAHDILNYLRLRRILRPQDTFVFDGGFVYDSVLRVLAQTQAKAIWIRRGLWQPGQKRDATLEREKAFKRVIVPEEAFEELNEPLTFGHHVKPIGPIVEPPGNVQPIDHEEISERFDRPSEKLVVSMLGGGEASDRTAQTMHLAALAERRSGVLHLAVAWPGAVVAPGLFGWENTRVVQTQDALSLALAADFVVSAVGYNGFHECMYHQIPALFVPQIAPYMDDQERRARAALDRGLAELAMPGEMALFERIFDRMLEGRADEMRDAIASTELPERGNAMAARLIEEVANARA